VSPKMTAREAAFADKVFSGRPPGRIWLTNLPNGARKFTRPSPDGSILVNLGESRNFSGGVICPTNRIFEK
jgi:hypothetical protein